MLLNLWGTSHIQHLESGISLWTYIVKTKLGLFDARAYKYKCKIHYLSQKLIGSRLNPTITGESEVNPLSINLTTSS